jgi:hypothetical protein
VPDEIDLLRLFRDEMPGPSTDAWARARAAVAAARSEETPPGPRPMRRPGRRRLSIAAAGTVAAVVTGLVAALLSGSPPTRPAGRVQAMAFVARVERALAPPRQHDIVGYSSTVLPPGSRILLGAGYESGGPGVRGGLAVGVEVLWWYRGTSTLYGFTRSGRRVFAQESVTVTNGKTVQEVTVTVIYADATWWRATLRQPSGPQTSTAPRCGPGVDIGAGGWPAFFRFELGCGEFRMAGRLRAGGVQVVKLTERTGTTAWVNPVTYLPVRVIVAGREPSVCDFRWLAPTPASLATLSVQVPAGFRQVRPPTAVTP